MRDIAVSVPDDVYRDARIAAAQRGTSVSALVVAFLEQLAGRAGEFERLAELQRSAGGDCQLPGWRPDQP